jgi:hypothetical protein
VKQKSVVMSPMGPGIKRELVIRQKNRVVGPGTKIDCPGEDQ